MSDSTGQAGPSKTTQLRIPFDASFDESMNVFRAMLRGIEPSSLELTLYQWGMVREVLQAIWCHSSAKRDGWCRKSAAELVDGCEHDGEPLTVSQFMAYRTRAQSLGLINKRKSSHQVNGIAWRVDIMAVEELLAMSRQRCESARVSPNHSEPLRVSQDQSESVRTHRGNLKPQTSNPNTSPPPPPRDSRAEPKPPGVEWEEVEVQLLNCGLKKAAAAIAAAVGHGATPSDASEAIAFWHEHRDTFGHHKLAELYQAIERLRAGMTPQQLWPEQVAAVERQAEALAHAAEQERQASTPAARKRAMHRQWRMTPRRDREVMLKAISPGWAAEGLPLDDFQFAWRVLGPDFGFPPPPVSSMKD